ncbi:MAG: hypothetical protein R3C44_17785 [Chloroflexota bacterium]
MARYRSGDNAYAPEDTVRWLTFLAQRLAQQSRPSFFVEDIQPSWLPPEQAEAFSRWSRLLALGLLSIGGLVRAGGPVPLGWRSALVAVAGGLVAAAIPVLTGRFLVRARLSWTAWNW